MTNRIKVKTITINDNETLLIEKEINSTYICYLTYKITHLLSNFRLYLLIMEIAEKHEELTS